MAQGGKDPQNALQVAGHFFFLAKRATKYKVLVRKIGNI